MQLLTAIVKSYPRAVNTKYGERSVMDVTLENGTETAIWGGFNCQDILGRRVGERLTVGLDSKGKYHIVETLSSGLSNPYQPQPQPQPVATTPYQPQSQPTPQSQPQPVATTQPQNQPQITVKTDNKTNDLNRLIERHASIMAKCVREIKGQLGDVSEDIIQKYATSLYIQISRQLETF